LRDEIRKVIAGHVHGGALNGAVVDVYRAGWAAGEIAAADAVARVKPTAPPTVAVPLHHQPTPEFR
jgi:hypothetical protein